ncbi:hypothetical protein CR513_02215, partial [Mucuna pruriens]
MWFEEFETHKTTKGDTWVLSKAEMIVQISRDDVSSHQFNNDMFYDVVGGMNKKGRILGQDSEARKYKLVFSITSSDGISLFEYDQMNSKISNLTEEN